MDDVIYGCANQAGEDNRNVARMALLLAGLPEDVPGATINRLCGSGLDALGHRGPHDPLRRGRPRDRGWRREHVACALRHVQGRRAFARDVQMFDTTIGWRFVNTIMKKQYGVDSMPETGENVAAEFKVSRADQDAFALRSQQRAHCVRRAADSSRRKSCP